MRRRHIDTTLVAVLRIEYRIKSGSRTIIGSDTEREARDDSGSGQVGSVKVTRVVSFYIYFKG